MRGIPAQLYNEIRAALLDCGPFADPFQLQTLFDDPSLRPWRHSVPGGFSPQARVDALMTFLFNKPYDQPNPLIRFMRVLAARTSSGCQRELERLARDLARQLGEPTADEETQDESSLEHKHATQAQLKLLHAALLGAYPTRQALARMVRYELGLNLEEVAPQGNQQNTIYELIMWAESSGRLGELAEGAYRHTPTNEQLAAAARELG